MAQAFAVDGGRSMGAAQVACRLLWLGLSSLKEADKLLNLPTSRESLFGSDMQTLVDRMESAAKASVQLAPPSRLRWPQEVQALTAPPGARPSPPHRPREGERRQGEDRHGRCSHSGPCGGKWGGRETFNKGRPARYIQERAASVLFVTNSALGAPVVTQTAKTV